MRNPDRVHPAIYLGSLAFSVVAALFLIWLVYFKRVSGQPEASWVSLLPWLNACLNGGSAYHLTRGWMRIRARQIGAHRQHMLHALIFSALFLISYVTLHALRAETKFPADLGWIRSVYLALLFSHIGLSIVVLPFILISFALALTGKFNLHPKFGRFTLPVWLYVSVTGVIVTLVLKYFVPGY